MPRLHPLPAFRATTSNQQRLDTISRRRIVFLFAASGQIIGADSADPPPRGQSGRVLFPKLGEVNLIAEIHSKQLPAIVFKPQNREREMTRLKFGGAAFEPKYIEKEGPYPIIRFRVLRFTGLATPIVFAAAMDAGGSDCTYAAILAGEIDGKIVSLSPDLPMVNAEGGYAIQRNGASVDLFAWNFIWGPSESHVDPHDYWVRVYRFHAGRFVFFRRYIVKKSEPEISYPNLLRGLKDFEC